MAKRTRRKSPIDTIILGIGIGLAVVGALAIGGFMHTPLLLGIGITLVGLAFIAGGITGSWTVLVGLSIVVFCVILIIARFEFPPSEADWYHTTSDTKSLPIGTKILLRGDVMNVTTTNSHSSAFITDFPPIGVNDRDGGVFVIKENGVELKNIYPVGTTVIVYGYIVNMADGIYFDNWAVRGLPSNNCAIDVTSIHKASWIEKD